MLANIHSWHGMDTRRFEPTCQKASKALARECMLFVPQCHSHRLLEKLLSQSLSEVVPLEHYSKRAFLYLETLRVLLHHSECRRFPPSRTRNFARNLPTVCATRSESKSGRAKTLSYTLCSITQERKEESGAQMWQEWFQQLRTLMGGVRMVSLDIQLDDRWGAWNFATLTNNMRMLVACRIGN